MNNTVAPRTDRTADRSLHASPLAWAEADRMAAAEGLPPDPWPPAA